MQHRTWLTTGRDGSTRTQQERDKHLRRKVYADKHSGVGSVGNLERKTAFAELFPFLAPGFVDGAFGIVGGGFLAGEFDRINTTEIAELGAFGSLLHLPVLDEVRGHFPVAGNVQG